MKVGSALGLTAFPPSYVLGRTELVANVVTFDRITKERFDGLSKKDIQKHIDIQPKVIAEILRKKGEMTTVSIDWFMPGETLK